MSMTEHKMAQIHADLAKAKTVREMWQVYLRAILPASAHPTQVIETRRAFYCGAQGLLQIMLQHTSDSEEVTAAEVNLVGNFLAEFDTFNQQIKKGAA